MERLLKKSAIGLLAISVFALLDVNTASASEEIELIKGRELVNNFEINSTTKQVWLYRSYSTDIYNNDVSTSRTYKPFPKSIWVSNNGYSGYVYVDSYYKSKTHYEVTYTGILRQGPIAQHSVEDEAE